MTKHVGLIALAVLVALALLLNTVAYVVAYDEIALVKTFGRTTSVHNGREEAGLKFKWPWPVQSLVKYDGRKFVLEDTSTEVNTQDKQNLLITLFCSWQIGDADRFHSTIGMREKAQTRLRDLLRSRKSNVVGNHVLAEFVNTEPEQMALETIEREILVPVAEQARADYGIDVLDVGIRRMALPERISAGVIDMQRQERQAEVERLQAEGEAQASAIEAQARKARDQILAFAEAQARNIRSQGEAAAAEQYRYFEEDPRLAMFLRSLESLRKELKERTVLLLESSMVPAVRLFHEGPAEADLNVPGMPPELESGKGSGGPSDEETE